MDRPTVLVELVFLPPEEGGRQYVPLFGATGKYRPHLVVQDRAVRRARMTGNSIEENYLGVSFEEGPAQYGSGETVKCVLSLLYFPNVDYSELAKGASFTVREGPHIVGHGLVLERRDAR